MNAPHHRDANTRADVTTESPQEPPRTALVMFADRHEMKCLRWLRRGFRHCFVAVETDGGWVVYDPLSHQTDLAYANGATAEDLARWYRRHELVVVQTRISKAPMRMAPIRPYTCVEAVKRVLGLHEPHVWTPWQLHQHLSAGNDETGH